MKIRNLIILLSSLSLIGLVTPISEVKANDVDVNVQETYNNNFEAVEVSKEQVIEGYAQLHNVTFEEASKALFPAYETRSASDEEISYVMLRSAAQYTTRTQNLPNNAGQVYFYCEVSTGGGFRGIIRIIYAGYNAGSKVFNGQFQYHLADPNRIHYTLNGGLYSNTTYTVSGGGSVGIGKIGSMNVSVSATSNFIRNMYHHGDVRY